MMRAISLNVNEFGVVIYIHRPGHKHGISTSVILRTPAQILRGLWLAARLAEKNMEQKPMAAMPWEQQP